jgi:nitric oxide reductase subunit B
MDFGSLSGAGSYFGEDYTASALRRLTVLTEDNLAQARFGIAFGALSPEQQSGVRTAMQQALQGIDLTRREVTLPDTVAGAVARVREEVCRAASTRLTAPPAGRRPTA